MNYFDKKSMTHFVKIMEKIQYLSVFFARVVELSILESDSLIDESCPELKLLLKSTSLSSFPNTFPQLSLSA